MNIEYIFYNNNYCNYNYSFNNDNKIVMIIIIIIFIIIIIIIFIIIIIMIYYDYYYYYYIIILKQTILDYFEANYFCFHIIYYYFRLSIYV